MGKRRKRAVVDPSSIVYDPNFLDRKPDSERKPLTDSPVQHGEVVEKTAASPPSSPLSRKPQNFEAYLGSLGDEARATNSPGQSQDSHVASLSPSAPQSALEPPSMLCDSEGVRHKHPMAISSLLCTPAESASSASQASQAASTEALVRAPNVSTHQDSAEVIVLGDSERDEGVVPASNQSVGDEIIDLCSSDYDCVILDSRTRQADARVSPVKRFAQSQFDSLSRSRPARRQKRQSRGSDDEDPDWGSDPEPEWGPESDTDSDDPALSYNRHQSNTRHHQSTSMRGQASTPTAAARTASSQVGGRSHRNVAEPRPAYSASSASISNPQLGKGSKPAAPEVTIRVVSVVPGAAGDTVRSWGYRSGLIKLIKEFNTEVKLVHNGRQVMGFSTPELLLKRDTAGQNLTIQVMTPGQFEELERKRRLGETDEIGPSLQPGEPSYSVNSLASAADPSTISAAPAGTGPSTVDSLAPGEFRIKLNGKSGAVRVVVTQKSTIADLVAHFRRHKNIPDSATIAVEFDHDRVPLDGTLEDLDVEDDDALDIFVS